MHTFAIILPLLIVIVSCYGNKLYSERNKEAVYSFRSELNVGVKNPNKLTSQFAFTGELHVRPNYDCGESERGVLMFMENPKVYAFTGDIQQSMSSMDENFIEYNNFEKLRIPICVKYDRHTGIIHQFDTESLLEPLQGNWMRSIASLFQVQFKKPSDFSSSETERTTYGDCAVKYNTQRSGDNITIQKTFNQLNCEDTPYIRWYNVPQPRCSPLSASNFIGQIERLYHATQMDTGDYLIRNISSKSSTVMPLFNNYGDTYYEITRQNVQFIKMMSISKYSNHIKFGYWHKIVFDNVNILSNVMRKSLEAHEVEVTVEHIEKIAQLLQQFNRYLKKEDIRSNNKTFHNNQILNDIIDRMQILNSISFEMLYSHIEYFPKDERYDIREIFLSILPTIGTNEAMEFFETFIMEDAELPDSYHFYLLTTMPLHLDLSYQRNSTAFYRKLIASKPMSPHTQMAAQLGYATVMNNYHEDNIYKSVGPTLHPLNNDLKSATTFQEQLTALYALSNFKFWGIHTLLVPIIRGENVLDTPFDWRLRQHAIYIGERFLKPDNAILWIVLEDTAERMELRIAALKVLVSIISEQAEVLRLHELMREECNPHVYNYWYTLLQQTPVTTCEPTIWDHLKWQDFKNLHPDAGSYAVYNKYQESKIGYSSTVFYHQIADAISNDGKEYIIEEYHQIAMTSVRLWSVYIRINELEDEGPSNSSFHFESLKSLLNANVSRLDVVVKIFDKTIFVRSSRGKSESNMLSEDLRYLLRMLNILLALSGQYTHTNDLGFLFTVFTRIPIYMSLDFSISPTPFTLHFKQIVQASYGIKVFNPIIDSLHGVKRFISWDSNLAFNITKEDGQFSFVPHSEMQDVAGIRLTMDRGVFFHPINTTGILEATCNLCKKFERDFNQNETIKDVEFLRHESFDLGYKVVFAVKQCREDHHNYLAQRFGDWFLNNGQYSKISLNNALTFLREIMYTPLSSSSCSVHFYLNPLEYTSKKIRGVIGEDPNYEMDVVLNYIIEYDNKTIVWSLNGARHKNANPLQFDFKVIRKESNEMSRTYELNIRYDKTLTSSTGLLKFRTSSPSHLKVENGTEVVINIKGEKFALQNDDLRYHECSNNKRSLLLLPWKCLTAKHSPRMYTINVTHTNVSQVTINVLESLGFWMMKTHDGLYISQQSRKVKSNEIQIQVLLHVNEDAATVSAFVETFNGMCVIPNKLFNYNLFGMDVVDIFSDASINEMRNCFIVPEESFEVPLSSKSSKAIQPKAFTVLAGEPSFLSNNSSQKDIFNDDDLNEIPLHWEWAILVKGNETNLEMKMGHWILYYGQKFYSKEVYSGLNTTSLQLPMVTTNMPDGIYWQAPNDTILLYLSDYFYQVHTKESYLVGDCVKKVV